VSFLDGYEMYSGLLIFNVTGNKTPVKSTVTETHEECVNASALAEIAALLDDAQLHDELQSGLIDTPTAVALLVGLLADLPDQPPSIYVDLEGVNLSRHGSISIIQIHILPTNSTYLVDVNTIRTEAFSTVATNGHTLKSILESEAIPKAFFDIRNDSDALFDIYHVKVSGICDIQLMELATRSFSKKACQRLGQMYREGPANDCKRREWMENKEKSKRLFAPECGGSYEVFNTRPLPEKVREYCMQDVQLLPRLWLHYHAKMSPQWKKRVESATQDRIQLSQSANFNGKGRHMALGPWS
jgi:exonuclease 3'-5' domain-containing protein 1